MLATARELFGGHVSVAVAELLEEAVQSYADAERAERLLWEARRTAPQALPVYFSLYKFYFYQGDLAHAELAARMALAAAARQGGFDADWQKLDAASADWSDYAAPSHFYLFSLKALAFIRLRQGDAGESSAILTKLAEIDPGDAVGACVVRAVAEAAAVVEANA